MLLYKLRDDATLILSDRLGVHKLGLSQLARTARAQSIISGPLANKLIKIDWSYNLVRHMDGPKLEDFLGELVKEAGSELIIGSTCTQSATSSIVSDITASETDNESLSSSDVLDALDKWLYDVPASRKEVNQTASYPCFYTFIGDRQMMDDAAQTDLSLDPGVIMVACSAPCDLDDGTTQTDDSPRAVDMFATQSHPNSCQMEDKLVDPWLGKSLGGARSVPRCVHGDAWENWHGLVHKSVAQESVSPDSIVLDEGIEGSGHVADISVWHDVSVEADVFSVDDANEELEKVLVFLAPAQSESLLVPSNTAERNTAFQKRIMEINKQSEIDLKARDSAFQKRIMEINKQSEIDLKASLDKALAVARLSIETS